MALDGDGFRDRSVRRSCRPRARRLRHIGPAFAEDPVRVLRIARFAARFAEFTVAPETAALMRGMADSGEIDALVPERVWAELSRGLMEKAPARMIAVLRESGALARLLLNLTGCGACRSALNTTRRSIRACI